MMLAIRCCQVEVVYEWIFERESALSVAVRLETARTRIAESGSRMRIKYLCNLYYIGWLW